MTDDGPYPPDLYYPSDEQVLAVLKLLGWPDDREPPRKTDFWERAFDVAEAVIRVGYDEERWP